MCVMRPTKPLLKTLQGHNLKNPRSLTEPESLTFFLHLHLKKTLGTLRQPGVIEHFESDREQKQYLKMSLYLGRIIASIDEKL